MKKMKVLFSALLVFLFITSHGQINHLLEKEKGLAVNKSTIENRTAINPPVPMPCFITPAIVDEGSCSGNGLQRRYSIYVSSGQNTVNQDRHVTVAVIHDGSIVDGKLLVIPANQHLSDNQFVFTTPPSESYGLITLKVTNVSTGGYIDNSCTWRETSPTVRNCFRATLSGGEPDFCNGNDADGDGICDDIDPSIEGPGN